MSQTLNQILDDLEDQGKLRDDDALYQAFSDWAESTGRPLYPHQDEALLEILTGHHVIAATPTGSGKSMIALAAHFVSLAHGGRSYYTAPLKALVSEKFFDLVHLFGADNVGMVTGDVSLNADAPIICCTAEILANQALREGSAVDTDMVIMDEFHYYGDPQRGWAWQVPLLELTTPQFIAMSATLGDVSGFQRQWKERTGRDVALVAGAQRPVPLEFNYVVETLPDTVERLLKEGRWPIYVVHFGQKDAVETAQALERAKLVSKEQREKIKTVLAGVAFGKGFGQTLKVLLLAGIGVHHAGMLPRYRRLVERLTQQGLLAVVCGTDTLGVGINVPIRTVVLTSLVKFDGTRMRHLSAREFHQIAGRAGRAGFDLVGFVRVLAPESEVNAAKARAKLTAAQESAQQHKALKKAKKQARHPSKAADGTLSWTRDTYQRLVDAAPEALTSQFAMTHSMVLNVLAGIRDAGRGADPQARLFHLARDNDDRPQNANPHLRSLGNIYRSMRRAGVLAHVSSAQALADGKPRLRLVRDLPDDFALNQPLSPFALAALDLLDPQAASYSLDVISVIEAVLEDPRPVLFAQQARARAQAVAAMKAEGVEYEERMERLEEVTWPQPLADVLEPAFHTYVQGNPWVGDLDISPKSVVRDMIEHAMTFTQLVSTYDVARSEGVVLRYLTDAYRALKQIVPDAAMTEELTQVIDWLGHLVRAVDSSLLDEWEALSEGRIDQAEQWASTGLSGGPGGQAGAGGQLGSGGQLGPGQGEGAAVELAFGANPDGTVPFSANRHLFRTAIRNALFNLVTLFSEDAVERLGAATVSVPDRLQHLAGASGQGEAGSQDGVSSAGSAGEAGAVSGTGDADGAVSAVGAGSAGDAGGVSGAGVAPFDADRWDQVLERFWAEHEWVSMDQEARAAQYFSLNEAPDRADLIDAGLTEATVDQLGADTGLWVANQTLVDDAGDNDWRIWAVIDVPTSDATHQVALAITQVKPD